MAELFDETSTARSGRRIGGRLCLDFVNTVSGWEPDAGRGGGRFRALEERMPDYPALLDGSRPALDGPTCTRLGLLARREAARARAVLRRARELRAALYRIFRAASAAASPDPADVDLLDREWRRGRARERLVFRRRGFAVAADPAEPPASAATAAQLELPLHAIARSAVELLTSPELARVRHCPGEACGWLFLDTSRSGQRRWCTMKDCGNLAKVRRFRAGARSAAGKA